ncbi:hypothetical protein [Leptolyngbya sp. FACHB-261]|uniref:hypothetical protein n=1 Tax=Leptolyngbya sp. FACHB-261 TaxID=2692806 RepID=UPI0016865BEA|nr:hypothetical protein [Leptolyngbya sp. FACHB-261]MBD2103056.1 hypothetical protein [Leptolyngbya sp. FACHB-261]
MIVSSPICEPCQALAQHPGLAQKRPLELQGQQRALATLCICLEEAEEEIEALQELRAELRAKIIKMQQRIQAEEQGLAAPTA